MKRSQVLTMLYVHIYLIDSFQRDGMRDRFRRGRQRGLNRERRYRRARVLLAHLYGPTHRTATATGTSCKSTTGTTTATGAAAADIAAAVERDARLEQREVVAGNVALEHVALRLRGGDG